jgi:hypothetical protein
MKKKPQKTPKKFKCEKCHFTSRNKKDFFRHLSTTKHKMDNLDNWVDKSKNPRPHYVCVCGKKYKYQSGLCKHKKKCSQVICDDNEKKNESLPYICSENNIVTVNMLNDILQQNKALCENLIELSKEKKYISYQNCNNKKMTINVFLNEECKDAMNLTDFVENVKVSLEDLNYTKENGYIDGISNIFVKHLKDMPATSRPIHCSDKKRCHFYVKESNVWEKDKTHEKINKSIQDITFKQIKKIKEWEDENPNYLTNELLREEWQMMIMRMMGGKEKGECKKNIDQIKRSLCTTTELKGIIDEPFSK